MPTTRWTLRQVRPSDLRLPRQRVEHTALTLVLAPDPALLRFLYETVGNRKSWIGRLDWADTEWEEHVTSRRTELWLSWQHGRPTGFAEVTPGVGPAGDVTRIDYLGLLPDCRGVGLGGRLVWDVTRRCWEADRRRPALSPVKSVELETTSLDAPAALPNYRKRGFQIDRYSTVVRTEIAANRHS
ncbi:GNAT family N-acetyltransferase [Pseudonocardia sp.]|uniref:GNAT family N-acetyltransferase n=1 Tax=Pseudonocardia sp. TaxID=60912 RepID=UPI002637F68F|nr:GNAT family N-acetyltransferase [Pseudonocardia sp.]